MPVIFIACPKILQNQKCCCGFNEILAVNDLIDKVDSSEVKNTQGQGDSSFYNINSFSLDSDKTNKGWFILKYIFTHFSSSSWFFSMLLFNQLLTSRGLWGSVSTMNDDIRSSPSVKSCPLNTWASASFVYTIGFGGKDIGVAAFPSIILSAVFAPIPWSSIFIVLFYTLLFSTGLVSFFTTFYSTLFSLFFV